MRSSSFVLAAAAALGIGAFCAPPADAITAADPIGIRTGIEALNPVEPVHCRRYKHRHRYGHHWGYGCRTGVGVYIEEESDSGVVIRERRHERGERSRTTIRSGTEIRSGTKTETGVTGTGTVGGGTTKSETGAKTGVKAGGSTKIETAPAPKQ